MLVDWLAAAALAAWLAVLLSPSQAWRTRERLEPSGGGAVSADLRRLTVLVPARNEAASIGATVAALAAQGLRLEVLVIDDESEDGTAEAALEAAGRPGGDLELRIIAGRPLPEGWGGKLWALEQGLRCVERELCLLLDADIVLAPGMIGALLAKAEQDRRAMVSIMARLECETFWEKLLVPPFIFFFKLLYPFAKANSPGRRTAAAAGGCILIRTEVLREIGGFAAIRDALIDDCALAARVKAAGHSAWLGLSESVTSRRSYPDLASFGRMVTRTAFTQLGYSTPLLGLVCCALLVVFVMPWLGVVAGGTAGRIGGAVAILAMAAAYSPTVRFYRLPLVRVFTLPIAALYFLSMTIGSALNYWRGVRAQWKGRTYAADRRD